MSPPPVDVTSKFRNRLVERYHVIDGKGFRMLIQASLEWLRANQEVVNALNVFPVPDGDTGTNMVLTLQSAVDEIADSDERAIGKVAHSLAHGALMGARGNSGVILSQLWRGFSRALGEREIMDAQAFAEALDEAKETAYKGVVKPVEGTILTVSKDIASAASAALDKGIESGFEILEIIVAAAEESVERTPDLLPVLKDAGVVDSGGKGLFLIFEGALRAAYRQPLDQPLMIVQPLSSFNLEGAIEAIEPGQDWEVVIDFKPMDTFDLQTFYGRLEDLGTSIQVGEGDGLYRMHIHVPDQTEYEPIEYIKGLGTITRVEIENLMDQLDGTLGMKGEQEFILQEVDQDHLAVIAVAPGNGFARVFASLGVAAIIEGGQTMNPSTKEIIQAFEDLPTDKIVILPNNKNIILAAEQAREMSDKAVVVIPTVSIPQGIAAMFAFNSEGEFEPTIDAMNAALNDLQSAEITTATRTVEIDGVSVKEGQVIGLLNGKLACSGNSLEEVLIDTLEQANAEDNELITLYAGVDLSPDQAQSLTDKITELYPDQEIEAHRGGQPHYQVILSIE
ncbi:MAG: DAK2 domain-containing protein [Anaerolineales bacterium]